MISDAVVIGVVLGLVFAATCYYLYTRSSSLERKVGLMENILLDLKVTTEQVLMSATEAPSGPSQPSQPSQNSQSSQQPQMSLSNSSLDTYDEHATQHHSSSEDEMRTVSVDSSQNGRTTTNSSVSIERQSPSVSSNYEAMTYKELVAIAKQKGVSGTRNASKAHVIDLLRRHDMGSSSKQIDEVDSLDAHFTTTPLDENMESSGGTDLELLSANELLQNNDGASRLETNEVEASLVQ